VEIEQHRALAIETFNLTCRSYLDRAQDAAARIEDEGNRTYVEGELATIACP
jgi:hypothetical protein